VFSLEHVDTSPIRDGSDWPSRRACRHDCLLDLSQSSGMRFDSSYWLHNDYRSDNEAGLNRANSIGSSSGLDPATQVRRCPRAEGRHGHGTWPEASSTAVRCDAAFIFPFDDLTALMLGRCRAYAHASQCQRRQHCSGASVGRHRLPALDGPASNWATQQFGAPRFQRVRRAEPTNRKIAPKRPSIPAGLC
jgi:hypothetical protein